jgi:uncharacterized membrane protein YjjP (DUF1212 family)
VDPWERETVTDWVRKVLTRKSEHKGPRKIYVETEPNPKLVLLFKFSICMVGALSALEIAHLAFLGSWSSEVFAAITGLIGTVTGVLIGRHA